MTVSAKNEGMGFGSLHPYTIRCVQDAKALKDRLRALPVQLKSIRGRSLRLARQDVTVPRDEDGAHRAFKRLDGKSFAHGRFSQ